MNPIERAFSEVYDGYSADRIVVDPDLNPRFIEACHRQGLHEDDAILNRQLLNLRKQGRLTRWKTTKRTSFRDEAAYRFAAEIAARFMERKCAESLDRFLCDPKLAAEFDSHATRVAPGYAPLQYRWAALNLRKARHLRPELTVRVADAPESVHSWSMNSFSLEEVPASQGVYLLSDADQLLYIGESDNLRLRLKKHLDHSDNKGLARWLWEFGPDGLHIEVHVLKSGTPARIRKAIERELIRSRNPIFNVK